MSDKPVSEVYYFCWYRRGLGMPIATFLDRDQAEAWAEKDPEIMCTEDFTLVRRLFRWPKTSPLDESQCGAAFQLLCEFVESDCDSVDSVIRRMEHYVAEARRQIDFQI